MAATEGDKEDAEAERQAQVHDLLLKKLEYHTCFWFFHYFHQVDKESLLKEIVKNSITISLKNNKNMIVACDNMKQLAGYFEKQYTSMNLIWVFPFIDRFLDIDMLNKYA
ncbi:MAG: hypothetical protein M1838_001219 [Thelocarpon superellum]|nr:MAG: hypothetical protein M1838_001219 [Thelocarpon superellum]